jgi:hypothetical protein
MENCHLGNGLLGVMLEPCLSSEKKRVGNLCLKELCQASAKFIPQRL